VILILLIPSVVIYGRFVSYYMHVERIELIGFKSFCDKTIFDLHPGITSIVGPNGCGKSNIVDAFKWVLGEQSAKSLRGASMEDVIFFGSATKKSKGMAEVTLVLSGLDEKLSHNPGGNGDSGPSEITVTRRLYRSGDSEYLLNKTPCRLKDIKDVLLDTGLELKAYSILEQGRINHILSSKPHERRFLIEEVAGVMKYKVRKAEAVRKLEASKSNLQRLSDIINEIRRQINSIDRHARKAERYKKLFEEIKGIDLKVGKRETTRLKDEVAALTTAENSLKEKEAEASAKIHSSEAIIEEKRRACTDTEKLLGEARSGQHRMEKEVTEGEGKIALLKRDCENLEDRIRLLVAQDEGLSAEKRDAIGQLEGIETRSAGIRESLASLNIRLEEKNNSFLSLEAEVSESESALESERKNLFSKAEGISAIRNEISQLSVMIENIKQKAEKNSEDVCSVRKNISSLEDVLNDTKKRLDEAVALLNERKTQKKSLSDKLSRKKEELFSRERELYSEREELAALVSKQESLKEVDEGRKSKLDDSVKVLSHVSDIFETSREYETALEAILGDKLNASVVESQSDLVKALSHIKEKKGKRSGFISVRHAEMSHGNAPVPSPGGSGLIGKAVDFINVREGFEKVASALLSDVVLVSSLDVAFSFWQDQSGLPVSRPAYYVTLEGEVIEPSGVVFAGTEKGVLKIKRYIKELEDDITSKRSSISKTEGLVSSLRDEITRIENDIISVDGGISDSEKQVHQLEVKLAGMDEESKRQQRKLEFLSVEVDEDLNEKENLKRMLDERSRDRDKLEQEKKGIEERISLVQDQIVSRREKLESLRSELTEIKLEQTSINEKMASLTREKERLRSAVSDLDRKKSEMLNERRNIEASISSKKEEIAANEEDLKSKVVRIDGIRREVTRLEDLLEAKTAEVELLEQQQKKYSSELESIRKELSQVEMKRMESSMKYDYLREDLRKAYSVDIEEVVIEDELTQEEEERLPRLKEKLEAIGQVNLGTLDEYEELKSRYEFMTKQQEDVVNSIKALEDTISKINRSTKQRLRDAFDLLNEKFKEVFTALFGRGRAELILTEDDILEAGIEIVAQPPGKRLKSLLALSGGEQALTTLSLLFAGFMVKPTPVCILDEVDAPLDESNTGKFLKLLAELSKNIQFIAITHNRLTMEAADYIYGITMEEPGASKIISMHMTEPA
jgi:chromosome segregation protein